MPAVPDGSDIFTMASAALWRFSNFISFAHDAKGKDIMHQFSAHKLNTYLEQVPTWPGFVQFLLSFGLSAPPKRGNRSKTSKKISRKPAYWWEGREGFFKKLLLIK